MTPRARPTRFVVPALLLALAAAAPAQEPVAPGPRRVADDPREKHLKNLRQLTFAGENAEAYWSPDGARIVFQSTRPPYACDQIYVMNADGTGLRQVSSGKGRTTCGYFVDPDTVLWASTVLKGWDCPEKPDMSKGYVWPLYKSFDIIAMDLGVPGIKRLTRSPGYDAEATVSPDGKKIVFTSMRSGDPEIWAMGIDGKNPKQLTDALGYDGGAFFTPDGTRIVWRRSDPAPGKELDEYKALLAEGLVKPTRMDLWVMRPDGSQKKKVLANGAANFAPYGLPDGTGMIFASNLANPRGRNFDLYTIKYDGTGLTQITHSDVFDGFPMFSPDGTQLLFASNRFAAKPGETNLFLADWVP